MSYIIDTPEGNIIAPDCFEPHADAMELGGIEWLRLFAACQALMAPTKFYGPTHKAVRANIEAILGSCPKGKPGIKVDGSPFRKGGKEAIYGWLGIAGVAHERGSFRAVTDCDKSFIVFKGEAK